MGVRVFVGCVRFSAYAGAPICMLLSSDNDLNLRIVTDADCDIPN